MKKLVIVISVMGFLLWACKKGSDSFNSTTTLYNASINIPYVSLFLNGTAAIANDSFGIFKTNANIAASTYRVAFVGYSATGVPDTLSPVTPVFPAITSFPSGATYSAILYDSLTNPKLYYQQDNFPATVTDGKSSIRFFNLMPDTGSHIFLKTDTGTIGKFFVNARGFGDFGTYNAFAEVDTITNITLALVKDTTTALTKKLATYTSGFKNGKIYSLYLIGVINGTGSLKPTLIVKQNN